MWEEMGRAAVGLRLKVGARGTPKKCVASIPLLMALGKENQQDPIPISKERTL